ncbi:MAG: serine kinase [Symploca sp. SIO3C6]|uniref:Serine kinase n=1 Tax=Symploca sp. SIO1C4 TaxID=2607765 RepID=A0A6B3N0G9_9CYAN|nr:serine kinase [Symploca sp. SIO3C6]NER27186.1 serine kinase [Symploca sp. SIO1C4]
MFSYFAYGLGIHSDITIPEFIIAELRCDVTLNIKSNHNPTDYLPKEAVGQHWCLQLTRKEALFYVQDTGVFLVQSGNKIVIVPAPNASEQLIRFYLVGTVMGILLYQRGLLVLHASAVNIDGGAVAFLGVSGEGKSSTAAAFHTHGYSIITDDVAPVTLGKKTATISPGFPQIKLGSEIASTLGYNFESLVLLNSSDEKRGYRPRQEFTQKPLPIKRIYVLTSDSEFGIEALKPQEAVVELSRHSRPATLFQSPDAQHFLQCVNLVKECTLYRLKRPRNLALLPELVKLVEEDIAHDTLKATV